MPLVVPLFNIQYCQSKMDGINNSVYSWSIFLTVFLHGIISSCVNSVYPIFYFSFFNYYSLSGKDLKIKEVATYNQYYYF